jgi:regulatory protein
VTASTRKPKKKAASPLTRASLEEAALRYLDRFDCSASRLKTVLGRRIAPGTADAARREARGWIDELVERYQGSGLLDDQRFAKNFAERLRERGASRRLIQLKLRARGVSSETVDALTVRNSGDELAAAQAFAKRRRLGPYRPAEERVAKRAKDLAAMARAGFERDTALRAIGHMPSGDDDF